MIHNLFENQVAKKPNSIALISDKDKITYQELNDKANQLGRLIKGKYYSLYKKELKPGCVIAFLENCSFDMIAYKIAILKSGAAYLSIDPNSPKERMKYIIENSNVDLILTKENSVDRLSGIYDRNKIVATDNKYVVMSLGEYPAHNLLSSRNTEESAYIIYTSGSTGRLKGIIATHSDYILKHSKDKINYTEATSTLYFIQSYFDPRARSHFDGTLSRNHDQIDIIQK